MSIPQQFLDREIWEILDLARLAPSSHNTQPWKVSLQDGKIIVGYDPGRQLSVGDPSRRELFLSLGCFIQTLDLASRTFGYKTQCTYNSDKPDNCLTIDFDKAENKEPKWAELIRSRRSERGKLESRMASPKNIELLTALTRNKAAVKIINDKALIEYLGDMTAAATLEFMERTDFRNELSRWVRNNWTKKPDGMPGYTQGIPGPISLMGAQIIRKVSKTAADQAKKDGDRVRNSAAVALITSGGSGPPDWLDAGRLLQRLWLEATNLGFRASAISAPVISENTVRKITGKLQLKQQPVALLRLGYSKRGLPKASPRLKPQQFIAT